MMESAQTFLEDPGIRAYIHRIVGDEGIRLIQRFPDHGEYSDEVLAEKTGINLNTVRGVLYALYERRLAEYHRTKNNETGWLTYHWKLRFDNLSKAISDDMKMVLEKLKRREKYETENDFYICKDCQILKTFPQAMVTDFTCNECGRPFVHFDNTMLLIPLSSRIQLIKKVIEEM